MLGTQSFIDALLDSTEYMENFLEAEFPYQCDCLHPGNGQDTMLLKQRTGACTRNLGRRPATESG